MSSDITQEDVMEDVVDTSIPEDTTEPAEAPILDLTDVVAEEPEIAPQPDPVYTGPTLAEQVESLGFSGVSDDTEAANRLLESYHQIQDQNSQWADHYQRQAQETQQQAQHQQQQNQEYLQWQQDQAQQQQQATTDELNESWWGAPDFNYDDAQRYRQQFQTPEGELYWDWSANTPPAVRQQAEDYVNHIEKWTEDITRRPHEVLPGIIEQEFDKLFADRYGAVMKWQQSYQQEATKQQAVQQIHERNADWVYQKDSRSGQHVQDVSGNLVLSQEGQAVTNYINHLRESGIHDPQQLWQLATRMYAGDIATQRMYGQQQQVSSQQQTLQRNMDHLQRGAEHVPSAGGSIPRPETPTTQNSRLSAGDKLRQQALEDGLF